MSDVTLGALSLFNTQPRLFAVVALSGRQYKVTTGDVIVTNKLKGLEPGDVIRLDRVLLLGSAEYSLLGRPEINKNYTEILATVLEQTKTELRSFSTYKRRKRYRRSWDHEQDITVLRITKVEVAVK
jgi:large subunit ribosomal protein L21